jgi:hypothetical protein
MEAINALGTNALPTVARHLGKKDSALKLNFNQLARRFPGAHLRPVATAREWRWAMTKLFSNSGEESRRAAILALSRLSQDPDTAVRTAAVDCLSLCYFTSQDPEVRRALEAAQSDTDALIRSKARGYLYPPSMKEVAAPTESNPLFGTGNLLNSNMGP